MIKDAILDKTKKYRYELMRQWNPNKNNFVNFIMLNPSTADDKVDDRTINKCVRFAKKWNYDGMYVTNLFAFRSTNPKNLYSAVDPIGEKNDFYIKKYAKISKQVIVAWGNHGVHNHRDKDIIKLLKKLGKKMYCLGLNKNGTPKHPLFLNINSDLLEFIYE